MTEHLDTTRKPKPRAARFALWAALAALAVLALPGTAHALEQKLVASDGASGRPPRPLGRDRR